MAILFLIGAVYCLILAIRRFTTARVPYYVEKDPDITKTQKKAWSRFSGYSLLFWAGFSLMFASELFLNMWPFYIPMVLCAAGGVFMSLRASGELRTHLEEGFRAGKNKKPGAAPKKKKKKKKKK